MLDYFKSFDYAVLLHVHYQLLEDLSNEENQ